ncbi:XRE family transcriptional regulator [Aliivibrio finisterrensis]|uniref:XRE family transcriptional regulator n=2 Tax=Vibrionaceae TaxID=641 RepID=A0A4Q5KWV2_9GAMM|nr:XRE family transcriptional regulator [Aliivibrio finisterrensis]RYU49597.1 XRE family transcriptional regulator [Aliivibrio finisterrensis]RYU53426.1 XRE family transcriptional regulator [Aliivibrio finisterrensis]RYU53427.1 XRE family transcriptional regulator [Aliivibrio finisterrensis]RYU55439.1 XRE family transcriptional regulator [Aliivibrio finisterrensis]
MLKDVIKSARMEKGYTQEEIAKLVKVAKQTYLKWENGDTEPKATQIGLLATHLGITANEICSGKRHGKMSLEDFIIKSMLARVPQELITMYSWRMIPDHEEFFSAIENTNHDDYYSDMAEVATIEHSIS